MNFSRWTRGADKAAPPPPPVAPDPAVPDPAEPQAVQWPPFAGLTAPDPPLSLSAAASEVATVAPWLAFDEPEAGPADGNGFGDYDAHDLGPVDLQATRDSDSAGAQVAEASPDAGGEVDPDSQLDADGSVRSPQVFGASTAEYERAAQGEADAGTWQLDAGVAVVQPRSTAEVLSTLAHKVATGSVEQYQPVPLGFTPLDKAIGGGLRAGELLLIGGAQGTGKTTMAVQMARNIVLGGQASVLYICFEHDEEYLLNRIIALESILTQLPQKTGAVKLQDVRREILGTWLAQGSENSDLSTNPRLRPAIERINRYGPNLYLLRGSQTHSTIENIHKLIDRYKELSGDRRLVVFIDYMQKVPVHPEPTSETEKVTFIVQGLKDLALSTHVPMVSIVAADKEGLKASRLRNHHLRGSSAINYEADIILILNEKYQIVAKVNIEFNPYQAQRFREWVICTIEKNRGGQNAVDLEFQKHFEYSCFDSNGRAVQEKLIEERLYND